MKQLNSRLMIAGLVVLAMVLGATAVFAQAGESAETPDSSDTTTSQGKGFGRGSSGREGFAQGGGMERGQMGGRMGGQMGDRIGGRIGGQMGADDTALADALGISAEALQTAHENAQLAAIQQAVDLGLITQEMADTMIANGRIGFHRGPFGDEIDFDALLATELGISTEALETAQDAARQARLDQALADGDITQDQIDLMEAHHALKDVIDQDALLAGVLGVPVEELQAAKADGTLRDLVDATGLTAEELQAAMLEAHTAAVNQAVADGVITQAQADLILSNDFGMGGFGGPGGQGGRGDRGDRGGRGGHGGPGGQSGRGSGFGGECPGIEAPLPDSSNTNFTTPFVTGNNA